MAKLTAKQSRFCEEYLLDLNATQAAIRAGYSKKTAMEQGYQLLRKTSVHEYVQELQAARAKRVGISAGEVVEGLAAIAFSNHKRFLAKDGSFLPPHEWDDDMAAAVASYGLDAETGAVRNIRFWDKLGALEKLGKHLGMFIDRQVVDLKGGVSHEWTVKIVRPPAKDECALRPAGAHSPTHMHA